MIREWKERDRQLAVIRVSRIVKSLDKSYAIKKQASFID